MKVRCTRADLERWIDWVDSVMQDVPHRQTTQVGDGPERRFTPREHFQPVLDRLDRLDRLRAAPDATISFDPGSFEDYWRQSYLASYPRERRSDSAYVRRRQEQKGAQDIVLPAMGIPILCPATAHFEVESCSPFDDDCCVKVARPPREYRRRTVLGQKTHYRDPGEPIFCHGAHSEVNQFIQGQRGTPAREPRALLPDSHQVALRRFVTDVLGWPTERATSYADQDPCLWRPAGEL